MSKTKTNIRKSCTWLLLIVMLITCFSFFGCSKKRKYDPNNFLAQGTASNPYQIVKDPVTLKIFVPRGGQNPHFNDMKMFKKLSDITNLKFDFTEADTSAYTQMRSAAWEDSANLPDLFLFNNSIAEQVTYSEFGALAAFNDSDLVSGGIEAGNLIENYMPTYKQLLEDNFNIDTETNAIEVATFADGKMYSTLSVSDVPRDLTFKMFINQQWIDNLQEDGYTIPDADDITTIEQYVEVLQAFKDGDPNRNGKADEVPVTAKELDYLRNFLLAAYGYVYPSAEISNDKSSIDFVPSTQSYKKYLETMNRIWGTSISDSLIDRQVFSIKTDAQMAQKGLEGRLGSFCSAAAYLTVGMAHESEYVTFGPLTSEFYKGTPLQWGFSTFQPTGAVIPMGTPFVREVARLLDIMYSDLGCQLIAYGEEGVDFTWDDEEKTSWTFNVPSTWTGSQEDYRATITPNVGTASALFWKYDFVGKMNDPIITKLNRMSERYAPYIKEVLPSEVKLTTQEYELVELINASLEQYIDNAEYQFVTGDKSLTDTNWNSYLNDLKRYRSEELVQCYQNAYTRYLNSKS